ncbi:ribonuclease HII [Weissella uvarum]|uniref:ribonuclease HII n=1 Tax=Weissella uvarum TaxID=1479233 RepID=UPI00196107D9|nr:ribonuclease HII [Weissella uvarum]MBM7617562.1 ribonuclease HII [Weissella uvarum]MCM0595556.1 ribonuclease HII [Weissella uvarum]
MANDESISAIKVALANQPSSEQLTRWQADQRVGVQKLMAQYQRKQDKLVAQQAAFQARLQFEQAAWQQGLVVAGLDEVGRGPLAGPVVAGAVVIDENFDLLAVHDSKQLSEKKRQALDAQIKAEVVDYAFGVVDAAEIDRVNIYEASRMAMKQAVLQLKEPVDELLIDAMTVDLDLPQEKLIKGDDRSISIGAASILAKNYRDELMQQYDEQYPGYGFAQNAGYGTKAHLAGLEKLGPSPIHRKSFAPVKKYQK